MQTNMFVESDFLMDYGSFSRARLLCAVPSGDQINKCSAFGGNPEPKSQPSLMEVVAQISPIRERRMNRAVAVQDRRALFAGGRSLTERAGSNKIYCRLTRQKIRLEISLFLSRSLAS